MTSLTAATTQPRPRGASSTSAGTAMVIRSEPVGDLAADAVHDDGRGGEIVVEVVARLPFLRGHGLDRLDDVLDVHAGDDMGAALDRLGPLGRHAQADA